MLLEAAAESALEQQHPCDSGSIGNTFTPCPAYIVCTQPRRLAAVSVANRVASEMGTSVGGLVGYHVRLQARCSQQTRLLFCTHGVLLRQILSNKLARPDDTDASTFVHSRILHTTVGHGVCFYE